MRNARNKKKEERRMPKASHLATESKKEERYTEQSKVKSLEKHDNLS